MDSSGIKVHNGGDWLRHVWKVKKKGYLKIHFAVDIRTKQVVSMDVSSEKAPDGKRLKRLVNRAEENVRVRRVLADGAYDWKANFNFLADKHIKPVIRVRKGSVPRSRVPWRERRQGSSSWRSSPGHGPGYTGLATGGGSRVSSRASSASSGST